MKSVYPYTNVFIINKTLLLLLLLLFSSGKFIIHDLNLNFYITHNEILISTDQGEVPPGGPYLNIIKQLEKQYPDIQYRINIISEKINDMISLTMDNNSENTLKFAEKQMIMYITQNKVPKVGKWILNELRKFDLERNQTANEYPNMNIDLPEVYYFEHGLRFCSTKIKEYIKNYDILDIGAYIGDSAIILSKYTTKKIYSYEISPKLIDTIKNNLNASNIYGITHLNRNLTDLVEVFNKGISNEIGIINITDIANAGGSLTTHGTISINVTYIDYEVDHFSIKPKFIKADVEGEGLKLLEGAKQTIIKYRPVISIAIYHSYDEFFEIYEYMRQFPNYLFEFHSENDNRMSMCEVSAFFYPAEIVYPIYLNSNQQVSCERYC